MRDTTKNAKKTDLIVNRVFNAPVKRVWKAWIEPEIVKQWWGPEGFTCPVAKIDFRERPHTRSRAGSGLSGH
jgi:uncharacterized protein YndB with AHSA1/START domain